MIPLGVPFTSFYKQVENVCKQKNFAARVPSMHSHNIIAETVPKQGRVKITSVKTASVFLVHVYRVMNIQLQARTSAPAAKTILTITGIVRLRLDSMVSHLVVVLKQERERQFSISEEEAANIVPNLG